MSAIPTSTMRITEAFKDELNSKGKRGETLEEIIKRLINEKQQIKSESYFVSVIKLDEKLDEKLKKLSLKPDQILTLNNSVNEYINNMLEAELII